jgi:hypothetical protein
MWDSSIMFIYQNIHFFGIYTSLKYFLFKKTLFDLEVKVPQRSLWYTTHRLMVMHSHTKYNWKTKKLWFGQASLRRSRRSGNRKNQTKTMSPFVRRGDIKSGSLISPFVDIQNNKSDLKNPNLLKVFLYK